VTRRPLLALPFVVVASLLAALVSTGCGPGSQPSPSPSIIPPPPEPTAASPASYRNAPAPPIPALAKMSDWGGPATAAFDLAKPLSAFGLGLLAREASANPGGNVVLSPASVHDALVMTLNGARGQTAKQMSSVLLGKLSLGSSPG
jgi:hypothetical protein